MDKKKLISNIIFIVIGITIILILLKAPKPTTPPIPKDKNHKIFFKMKKLEAEKHCEKCHKKLPKNHPPKYRCLLCHVIKYK